MRLEYRGKVSDEVTGPVVRAIAISPSDDLPFYARVGSLRDDRDKHANTFNLLHGNCWSTTGRELASKEVSEARSHERSA